MILIGNRIVVPFLLRKKVLKLSHETHQDNVKTKQFVLVAVLLACNGRSNTGHDQELSRVCFESTSEQVHAASTSILIPR